MPGRNRKEVIGIANKQPFRVNIHLLATVYNKIYYINLLRYGVSLCGSGGWGGGGVGVKFERTSPLCTPATQTIMA